MKRLTFEGNFCDISMCQALPATCGGTCSQKETWLRLKEYEDREEQKTVTIKDKETIQRALGIIEGVASCIENDSAQGLIYNAIEMIDRVVGKEGADRE